jgi:hypothetical protein
MDGRGQCLVQQLSVLSHRIAVTRAEARLQLLHHEIRVVGWHFGFLEDVHQPCVQPLKLVEERLSFLLAKAATDATPLPVCPFWGFFGPSGLSMVQKRKELCRLFWR